MRRARELIVEHPGQCPCGENKVSGRWCSNPHGPAMCTTGEEFPKECPLTTVELEVGDSAE